MIHKGDAGLSWALATGVLRPELLGSAMVDTLPPDRYFETRGR